MWYSRPKSGSSPLGSGNGEGPSRRDRFGPPPSPPSFGTTVLGFGSNVMRPGHVHMITTPNKFSSGSRLSDKEYGRGDVADMATGIGLNTRSTHLGYSARKP